MIASPSFLLNHQVRPPMKFQGSSNTGKFLTLHLSKVSHWSSHVGWLLVDITDVKGTKKSQGKRLSVQTVGIAVSISKHMSWVTIRPGLNAMLLFQSHPVDRMKLITCWAVKSLINFFCHTCYSTIKTAWNVNTQLMEIPSETLLQWNRWYCTIVWRNCLSVPV